MEAIAGRLEAVAIRFLKLSLNKLVETSATLLGTGALLVETMLLLEAFLQVSSVSSERRPRFRARAEKVAAGGAEPCITGKELNTLQSQQHFMTLP